MATYQYRALQPNGQVTEGQLDANSRPDAFRQMEGRGLRPVSLVESNTTARPSPPKPSPAPAAAPQKSAPPSTAPKSPAPAASAAQASAAPAGLSSLFGEPKISARILENFTRLLSSLLAAGVPLSRALVILTKEAATPAAGAQWRKIHDLVIDGLSLASAMARFPVTFPRVYVAMVEAGETGGFLDVVLAQIADFQAREKEMRSKVMTALLYPVILLVLALGVLIFLLVFFIPRFQSIFSGFGAKLPLITQIIVGASDFLRSYGLFALAAFLAAAFGLRHWILSEDGRRSWEGLILRAPIIGSLVAQFAMARFSRMLGTLLGAGVPLVNGLNVARRSIGNQILVDAVSLSIERVKEGKQLGPSLSDCRSLFSGATLEMISVAEESGKLDQELVRIANVTESDLDRQLKASVALAEPLMLFFIAGFIGFIFIGMVIPIFSSRITSSKSLLAMLLSRSQRIMKTNRQNQTFIPSPTRSRNRLHAFTLIELLLVLVILGILAALVVPKFAGRTEQARVTAAQTQIATFGTALDAFEVDTGQYPRGKNGLLDLVQQPRDARNWKGPYLKNEIPKDPWGNDYIYEFPGKQNPSSYDLMSMGPDARVGGDDDVTNWQQNSQRR